MDGRRKSNPTKATVQTLIEYLSHLHKKGRALSTLLLVKSAIVKTLVQITGHSLGESGTLGDFLKNLKQKIPVHKNNFPKWDLCVVLKGLRSEHFEPLDQVCLRNLTFKTVFLVALATAARVSELSALSAEEGFVRIKPDKSKVTLRPQVGFLAKNQKATESPREMVIQSLQQHAQNTDPERLLCPVRAIRIYLERTNVFRKNRKKLFISYCEKGSKEITVNTISRWLRETIKLSYQVQKSSDIEKMYQVSAHEIRAIATSLLAWKNTSIAEVLRAAHWKNHSTFTDFYLRNMVSYTKTLKNQGGAVVCAGRELVLDI